MELREIYTTDVRTKIKWWELLGGLKILQDERPSWERTSGSSSGHSVRKFVMVEPIAPLVGMKNSA